MNKIDKKEQSFFTNSKIIIHLALWIANDGSAEAPETVGDNSVTINRAKAATINRALLYVATPCKDTKMVHQDWV